jgi:hypothetical protein
MRAAQTFGLIALMFVSSISADSWTRPSAKLVSSADTQLIVRIVPGNGRRNAQATYYKRDSATESYLSFQEIELPNATIPIEAYVNNLGVLVTVDSHGSAGFGPVVSIINKDGSLLRSYTLDDLYTPSAIREIPTTVSSRWWRNKQLASGVNDELFQVGDVFNNLLRFNLSDGTLSVRGENPEKLLDNP